MFGHCYRLKPAITVMGIRDGSFSMFGLYFHRIAVIA